MRGVLEEVRLRRMKRELIKSEVGITLVRLDFLQIRGDINMLKEFIWELKGWMTTHDTLITLMKHSKDKALMSLGLARESIIIEVGRGSSENGEASVTSAARYPRAESVMMGSSIR